MYLYSYNNSTDEFLEAMLKILKHEASLPYNLLSKIFVYNLQERITAAEMLNYP